MVERFQCKKDSFVSENRNMGCFDFAQQPGRDFAQQPGRGFAQQPGRRLR